jgi:signal transduction histidine kinase
MIRDLLGLFKITSTPEAPTRVDLRRLTARALESLAPQIAAKGTRVEVGDLPQVWGEEGKLAHVVANLLGNAVKYVPAGSGAVRVSGGRDDGHVVFHVEDNGIGIPAPYHEGIFNLFGRVPADAQRVDGQEVAGTGVGLAIVRGIVGAHGGVVTVESAPGQGSRFTVVLPAGADRDQGASLTGNRASVQARHPPAMDATRV